MVATAINQRTGDQEGVIMERGIDLMHNPAR
jgi:hypothetical protein